jgi:hypothetical protein
LADRHSGEGPSLFDLPLSPDEARRRKQERAHSDEARREEGLRDEPPGADDDAPPERGAERPAAPRAPRRRRPPGELPLFAGEEPGEDRWDAADTVAAGGPGAAGEEPFWEREEPPPRAAAQAPAEPLAGAAADWQDLEAPPPPHEEPFDEASEPAPELPKPAAAGARLGAALLDGGLLLVVTATAIVGSYLLGVRWQAGDLRPLAAFLLVFSFVYSVVPLAFWGRTPGMALSRITARGGDGGPLTFGQTALRWLGGLLTLALAGLPLLLALPGLGGRSLADRVSGTRTWQPPGG